LIKGIERIPTQLGRVLLLLGILLPILLGGVVGLLSGIVILVILGLVQGLFIGIIISMLISRYIGVIPGKGLSVVIGFSISFFIGLLIGTLTVWSPSLFIFLIVITIFLLVCFILFTINYRGNMSWGIILSSGIFIGILVGGVIVVITPGRTPYLLIWYIGESVGIILNSIGFIGNLYYKSIKTSKVRNLH
jgi:hypothetical protein